MKKLFLKPCPVCYGHTAVMFLENGAQVVRCTNCGCGSAAQATEEEAANAWNQRGRCTDRRYTKIKYTEKGVYIAYQQGAGFVNEYTVKCTDEPAPNFLEALMDLRQFCIEMCELPEDYLDRITVKSVSLNYGGEADTMGATITACMELYNSNAPLNINTPNKPEAPYNPDQEWDEKTCLTEDCVYAIRNLALAAEEYLLGTRQQTSLFDGEGKSSDADQDGKTAEHAEAAPHKVA